jgi:predicted dehydrogenase
LAIDYTLHKNQLNDLVDAIIKGDTPPVSAEDAMQSVALIEGIYKSSEAGIVINFKD